MALTRPRYSQIYDTDYKQSSELASTGDVGNLIVGNTQPNSVDGVSVAIGNRILVKDQTSPWQNGIYSVRSVGTGANGWWERSLDANQAGFITAGMTTAIVLGSANGGKQFKLATPDPITLGVTSLTFVNPFAASAGGANTQVQFNDNNSINATAAFTFNKFTNSAVVTGNITAGAFIGNGSQLTGLPAGYSNVQVATYMPTYTGTIGASFVNATGNILSTGGIFNALTVNGNQTVTGNLTLSGNLNVGAIGEQKLTVYTAKGNIIIGNVTQQLASTTTDAGIILNGGGTLLSGMITEVGGQIFSYATNTGQIATPDTTYPGGIFRFDLRPFSRNFALLRRPTGSSVSTNALALSLDTGLLTITDNAIIGGTATATGNLAIAHTTPSTTTTTGALQVAGGAGIVGNLNVGGNLVVNGNVTVTGTTTTQILNSTGNIATSGVFIGNGSQLTGLPAGYSNVQVATYLPTYTGNIANIQLGSNGVTITNDLYVRGNIYTVNNQVLNDISSYFNGVATVFPLRLDQTSINSITDSKDLEVTVGGQRLSPYVKELRWPWITPYDSFRGYRVVGSNVIIYNAPDLYDQATLIIRSTSQSAQTRRYPFSASSIALGD